MGLCPDAFQASVGGTAATDPHREGLWEQFHDTSQGKTHHQKGPFSGGCPQKELCELDCRTEEYAPFLFKRHLLQMPRITGDPREPLSTPRQAASSLGPSSSTVFLPCLHFIRFSLLMPSPLCLANPYLLVQNCPQRFTTGTHKISLGISSLITLAQNASVGFLCIYGVCVCVV